MLPKEIKIYIEKVGQEYFANKNKYLKLFKII